MVFKGKLETQKEMCKRKEVRGGGAVSASSEWGWATDESNWKPSQTNHSGGRGKMGRWKSGLGMTKDTHIEKTARLQ